MTHHPNQRIFDSIARFQDVAVISSMSNNGSFVPLSVAGGPSVNKPALGHVVSFPTSTSGGNYGGETKDKYKWHTVVDGFSKSMLYYYSRSWSLLEGEMQSQQQQQSCEKSTRKSIGCKE